MLRLIEFGILAVVLIVVIALIVTGRRKEPQASPSESPPDHEHKTTP